MSRRRPPDQDALLARLGFERRERGRRWRADLARARDVTREIDVVEEIARFRLEDVPFTLPARRDMFGTLTREQQLRRRLEDALVGLGFAETYTPSLVQDDETPWNLPEPISAELTALRTTLVPSLVDAARRNVDAGASNIALFEIARVYLPDGDLPEERVRVAGLAEGGFLHAKGAVEALYAALKAEPSFERAQPSALPSGQGGACRGRPRRRAASDGAGGRVGGLRARPRGPVRELARARHLHGCDHVSTRTAGHRRLGSRGRGCRRPGGYRAPGCRARVAEIRVFDVYRGDQVGDGRSRSRSRSLTSRRSARCPRPTQRACATRSSRRSRTVRRRARA